MDDEQDILVDDSVGIEIEPGDGVELLNDGTTEVVVPQIEEEVEETEEEIKARKETADYIMVKKNCLAIGDTLVHQGKCMTELHEINAVLRMEIAQLKLEITLNKNMIVKSLQQKYGNGPTASE